MDVDVKTQLAKYERHSVAQDYSNSLAPWLEISGWLGHLRIPAPPADDSALRLCRAHIVAGNTPDVLHAERPQRAAASGEPTLKSKRDTRSTARRLDSAGEYKRLVGPSVGEIEHAA
jgi:hypothetical protein